jgi:Domain of unknown function (DUF4124)
MQNAAMKIALSVLVTLIAMSSTMAASTTATAGKTYMWIDKNGERQYGDAVPPEYAQGERRVLNKDGVETKREGALKTPAQLAEEQRQLAEQQKREQHDHFLLTTYTSTRDIERLRDERLVQLDAQIKAATAYIETLDTRLKTLQERSQQFKPYNTKPNARRMPDDLAEQLVRGSSEAQSQRKALEKQRQELLDVRAQFDADSARYHELTIRNKAG